MPHYFGYKLQEPNGKLSNSEILSEMKGTQISFPNYMNGLGTRAFKQHLNCLVAQMTPLNLSSDQAHIEMTNSLNTQSKQIHSLFAPTVSMALPLSLIFTLTLIYSTVSANNSLVIALAKHLHVKICISAVSDTVRVKEISQNFLFYQNYPLDKLLTLSRQDYHANSLVLLQREVFHLSKVRKIKFLRKGFDFFFYLPRSWKELRRIWIGCLKSTIKARRCRCPPTFPSTAISGCLKNRAIPTP